MIRGWLVAACVWGLQRLDPTRLRDTRDLRLPYDVWDLVSVAGPAIAHADAYGRRPMQKHAIATRFISSSNPSYALRDVSLAVVLAHRMRPQ